MSQAKISILLPTRKRPELAFSSLKSLVDLADDPKNAEFLIAIDEDDNESAEYFEKTLIPWFEEQGLNCTVFQTPRWGYLQLHNYNNFMARHSLADWYVFWNDDAVMQSQGWDTEIIKHTGEFKILAFDTHDNHPYSIFPIIPRDWQMLFDQLSPHQQTDAWISQVAYLVDCLERIPVKVLHDRADLTGNNDDETFQEREYREGDTNDPMDINHDDYQRLKMHWSNKADWYMKQIGQGNTWLDQVKSGMVNPWMKLIENDPNRQMTATLDYFAEQEQQK